MNTLCWLNASDLCKQYAIGGVKPTAAVAATLERVVECEPKLNALYLLKARQAEQAAAESDARWKARQALSPLDGVPITLKENLFTTGDPAPIGTSANSLTPKTANAPIADRVREAGLVLIGKTTMPDFGMLSSGQSRDRKSVV